MENTIDLQTTADNLISQHGENALVVAENHMQQEMGSGDVKAAGQWLGIINEITKKIGVPEHQES